MSTAKLKSYQFHKSIKWIELDLFPKVSVGTCILENQTLLYIICLISNKTK